MQHEVNGLNLVPATECPLAVSGLGKRGANSLGSCHGAVASPVCYQSGQSELNLPCHAMPHDMRAMISRGREREKDRATQNNVKPTACVFAAQVRWLGSVGRLHGSRVYEVGGRQPVVDQRNTCQMICRWPNKTLSSYSRPFLWRRFGSATHPFRWGDTKSQNQVELNRGTKENNGSSPYATHTKLTFQGYHVLGANNDAATPTSPATPPLPSHR